MQSKQNNEHELVSLCMAELCAKAGFPTTENLVQRDLMFLCETVEAKTGVMISLSTIKRLINGQFSRLPQIATLDAIAVSAGYPNWRQFASGKNLELNNKNWTGKRKAVLKARYLVLGTALVLASAAVLVIMMSSKSTPGNIDKARFSAVKVTGNDIPNTVVFNYNIDSVKADSFFIQQSWDRNRRVRIYKNHYTLTDIYYEPGYHNAKLIADDKIIKTVPVSIPTDRWLFYAIDRNRTPESKPKYIVPANGVNSGSLRLTPDDVLNSKIDMQKNNDFCEVYFPSRFEYSSDNFIMKFRLRVKEVNNDPCLYVMSEVFCQNYFMYFKNTLKGCTSELDVEFGENFLSGQAHDLSMLGADIREWQDMEFSVKDKKVSISINGKNVFSSAYTRSCGLITGLGFTSNGLCELEFVDLKTGDAKTIYSNDFGR